MRTITKFTERSLSLASIISLSTIILALSLPVTGSAQVWGATSSYNLQHNFWFTPGWWPIWNQGPGWTPTTWFMPRGYAQTWAVASATSATDWPQYSSAWRSAVMPPRTFVGANAQAVSGTSTAIASASVQIGAFGPWGTTIGTVRASGWTSVSQFGARADAASGANISLLSAPGFFYQYAWWRWQPWFSSGVSGSASSWLRRSDPIGFAITDPETGQLLERGDFLHVYLDGAGDGTALWENGNLVLTPSSGTNDTMTVHVLLGDPTGNNYIRPEDAGELRITYTGDTITDVMALGQFSGWELPSVGYQGILSMDTPDIEFGVDFHRPVDVRFTAGTSVGTPVPEPATYGIIGAVALLGGALYRRHQRRC